VFTTSQPEAAVQCLKGCRGATEAAVLSIPPLLAGGVTGVVRLSAGQQSLPAPLAEPLERTGLSSRISPGIKAQLPDECHPSSLTAFGQEGEKTTEEQPEDDHSLTRKKGQARKIALILVSQTEAAWKSMRSGIARGWFPKGEGLP